MSLTLNQTPGNDNEAIFLLKILAEGNNIVPNSAFDDNTGWSEGADWVIGDGVATYAYDDEATGNLDITLEAAVATEYILEYTVTEVTIVTAFDFYLRGTYSSIQIELDKTIGKHTIAFVGNAAATSFGFGIGGMEAGESISIDNVKVRKKEDPIYLSTRDISLSPLTFDGKVISWNVLSDVAQYIDVESSGGIGSVTGYNFSIARHTLNTRTSDFFNEFFPAYDGGVIIARDVQLGIVWNTGSPDATDITWLYRGRVIDYGIQPRQLDLVILQTTEFDARDLPYYSIQKDFDNEVSYFTNAPDENYGYSLPIVYGNFSTYIDDQLLFEPKLFPIICIEKMQLRYICGSHKFYQDYFSGGGASIMYKYVDGTDTYMTALCLNGSSVNNDIRAYVTNYDTLNSTDNVVLGTINIRPTVAGSVNTVADFDNVTDGDTSTYITVTNGGVYQDARLALKIKGGGSPPGALSRLANSIILYCCINGEDPAGGTTGDLTYYNPEFDSGVGGYGTDAGFGWTTGVETKSKDMSVEFAGRNVTDEPWRWDELMNLEYIVFPVWDDPTSYAIDISSMWLRIDKIIVNDFRPIRRTGTGGRTGRNEGGR